jgi:hypothetical protein
MGLNTKTIEFLTLASGGSFLHLSIQEARKLLDKILIDKLPLEPEQNSIGEESPVAEPKILPEPSQPLADLNSEPLVTPVLDFMLDFEDELYADYRNTSKYRRKPRKTKKLSNQELLDPFDKAFLKQTTRELVSIISNGWLEESELSSDVIRLDTPSITIQCQIDRDHFEAFYNPVVGVNIMPTSFAQNLLKHIPLTPTTKLLKTLQDTLSKV